MAPRLLDQGATIQRHDFSDFFNKQLNQMDGSDPVKGPHNGTASVTPESSTRNSKPLLDMSPSEDHTAAQPR